MHPEVERLIEIQEVDVELLELQEQLNLYPSIWEGMKAKLREKNEALEKAKAAEADHQAERSRIERELRTSSERLKTYQHQQMLVKTSKELTAITNQIETLKKNIGELEAEGTALIELDEGIAADIASAEQALNELKSEAREERERIRKQVASKKERIGQLQAARAKLVARVDPQALTTYDFVRKRWPKDPVVPVRQGSCTGCHYALLPNPLVAVHQAQTIVTCDNCGRILSHDETFESEDEQTG